MLTREAWLQIREAETARRLTCVTGVAGSTNHGPQSKTCRHFVAKAGITGCEWRPRAPLPGHVPPGRLPDL